MASTSQSQGLAGPDGETDLLVEKSAVHVVTPKDSVFKAIGPRPIGKKKKYKFVEPPGITSWISSFVKKCLVCGLIYGFGYFQVSLDSLDCR
jgi:hypothetical protein